MSVGKNEIICKYKIDGADEIRILGEPFIDNNKNKCKIFYNGKEQELIGIINKAPNKIILI